MWTRRAHLPPLANGPPSTVAVGLMHLLLFPAANEALPDDAVLIV
jgi:hypothetical protein